MQREIEREIERQKLKNIERKIRYILNKNNYYISSIWSE